MDLTPEQQQILARAAARINSNAGQPVSSGLTPEQEAILAGARQRMANAQVGQETSNPLAMPDWVNQQPDATMTSGYIENARDERLGKNRIPEDMSPFTASLRRTIRHMKEAQTNPQGHVSGLDDLARSFGRGAIGVGPYLDEANAGFNAFLAPYVDPVIPDSWGMQKLPEADFGNRYNHALQIQREKDAQMDKDHPLASTSAKLLGGVATVGGLVKKAPAMADFVLGNATTRSLPAKMLASAASGVGFGAVQGFGQGEGDATSRLKEAGNEAMYGGAFGALMPAAATGTNKVAAWIKSKILGDVPDALSSVSPTAQKYVMDELADPNKVATMRDDLNRLGPDAMLADVSPDWFGVARGAATRPGNRSMIVDPLDERSAAANTRLRADVENNLGTDPVPSQIERGLADSRDQVARLYGPAFEQRTPFDFTPITNDLDSQIGRLRGNAQRALQQVRGMLNDHLPNANGVREVTSDPAVAFQTRQAIDGMLSTEADPKVISALSDARQMIDDALTRSVPRIKEIDAQYHELSRQSEGLSQGRPILNNEASAMRPSELQDMLQEGADPHGMMIGPSAASTRARQGALGEIYRAIGTKANDTTALRNVVRGEGDWNREKLGMLFGQENADNALNAIDRETAFGDTANRVTRGSDTAVSNRFGQFLDDMSRRRETPADTTLTGIGHKAAKELFKRIISGDTKATAEKVASDLGRLSVARGSARDQILDALLGRGNENVVNRQRAYQIENALKGAGLAGYGMLPKLLQ